MRLAWLAVFVVSAACSRDAAPVTPAPAAPLATDARPARPEGWNTFELAPVSFFGPPTLVAHHVNGEDSLVGEFVGPTMRVDFDFGWYSDNSFGGRYDGRQMRRGTLEQVVIDGHPARLATWTDNTFPTELPNACAIYVPDIDGSGTRVGMVALGFQVSFRDAADAATARAIALLVRIAPSPR